MPDAVRGEPFDKLRANGANSVFEAKVGLHKRFTLPFVVSQSNHERPPRVRGGSGPRMWDVSR